MNDEAAPLDAPSLRDTTLGRRLGLGAAALGTAALLGRPARAQSVPVSDAAILNFALNFEYLGAQYYLQAVNNNALPAALLPGGSGPVALPATTLVPFANPAIAYYGIRLAADEQAHVGVFQNEIDFLAQADYAISQPTLNLDISPSTGAWSLAAQAAGLVGPGQTFNPYESDVAFMLGAYMLEDVCVTALCGALSMLTSVDALFFITAVLGVEAMQAAAIRTYLADIGGGIATNAISAMRANLSGTLDMGTLVPGNPYNFANLDDNGLAVARTPGQVLAIAYGGVGLTAGLFFPEGVNGVFAGAVSG